MVEKQKSIIPGALLVVVGVLLLLHQLDIIYLRWRHLYPVILLALGILFFISALNKKDQGAVFPGTVLSVLGLFFLIRNFDLFSFRDYFYNFDFWPIFLIAFGLGFFALFLVKRDDWGVLIPGSILLFLGVVFSLRAMGYLYWWEFADFWPVILIVIGMSIILSSLRKKQSN